MTVPSKPEQSIGIERALAELDQVLGALRARGIRLVQDALAEVPGFHVVQPGSFGAVA